MDDLLSVVIPTHNRRELVLRLLDALARQHAPAGGFDVLVVVDGSTDGSAEAIRGRRWCFPVAVMEQRQSGQAAARNRGARAAQGEVLVFLDDDMVPREDFLLQIHATLCAGAAAAVGTVRLRGEVPNNVLTRQFASWTDDHDAPATPATATFDRVLFSATGIRRDLFEQLGGFDEAFTAGGAYGNEDIELGHRLLLAGADVRMAVLALAETDPVLDALSMLHRTRNVARNDVALVRKHPELAQHVFFWKLDDSRIHRLLMPPLLAAPWLERLTRPATLAVAVLLRSRFMRFVPYRVWFGMQAAEYWYGVAEAHGASLIRNRRRQQD